MTDSTTTQLRELGRIKWFNNKKGYGFVSRLSDSQDIFVHLTSINVGEDKVYKTLVEGEYVEFDVKTDDDGKTVAVDLTGPLRNPLLCQNAERRIFSVPRAERGTSGRGPRRTGSAPSSSNE